jgi:hypothetical protein
MSDAATWRCFQTAGRLDGAGVADGRAGAGIGAEAAAGFGAGIGEPALRIWAGA